MGTRMERMKLIYTDFQHDFDHCVDHDVDLHGSNRCFQFLETALKLFLMLSRSLTTPYNC